MPSQQQGLSRDTQATLLLVARLGDKPPMPPLNRREYNALAAALRQHQLRPGDLLDEAAVDLLQLDPRIATHERLRFLLGRRSALAFAVDSWINAGLWIVGRGDREYPQRVRRILRSDSPPILFGAGQTDVLQADGIGVVGSRDIDEAGAEFARLLGRLCATQQLSVVSGAARGADAESMLAAVDGGGRAVGVVAGELDRHSTSKLWRAHVRDGSVTLLSAFEPSARFTVGYAMERNRYIYAMSRLVAVVSATEGEGGTWAGAVENQECGWVPLVVRADNGVPGGNTALLRRGASPISREALLDGVSLRDVFRSAASEQRARLSRGETLELPLNGTSEADAGDRDLATVDTAEVSVALARAASHEPSIPSPHETGIGAGNPDFERTHASAAVDVFEILWPYLETVTAQPRTFDELKEYFPDVLEKQLKAWLGRAVDEGRIRRHGRPQRYSRR